MHDAYNTEFVKPKFSSDPLTQANLGSKTAATIDIANKYIAETVANNQKIKEILDSNYAFIDPDDIDIFMLFNEHYLRYSKEIDSAKLSTPLEIYSYMGEICYLQPEFLSRIKARFKEKKGVLDGLMKS